jgi:hypothetical protein
MQFLVVTKQGKTERDQIDLTNSTPCSWVLETPSIAQLIKNFTTFYMTRRVITVFMGALH